MTLLTNPPLSRGITIVYHSSFYGCGARNDFTLGMTGRPVEIIFKVSERRQDKGFWSGKALGKERSDSAECAKEQERRHVPGAGTPATQR